MESQEANFNAANEQSLSGIMAEVLKNFGLSLENCIPAIVKSYDRSTNIVTVQPAINLTLTNGEFMERDSISLPVFNYGGNGIVINFPLAAGNTGWIVASDRDSALFRQGLTVANANTNRQHQYSFGFFIPDKIKGATISESDDGLMVIQTLDGTTKIALGDGIIKILSSADVTVDCANLTITSPNVKINGELSVTGQISSNTDVLSAGISGKSHTHGGVQGGSGNTGAPQ